MNALYSTVGPSRVASGVQMFVDYDTESPQLTDLLSVRILIVLPSDRFAVLTSHGPTCHTEEREKLLAEELGRELTPRQKFYVALADACAPRRAFVLCIEDNKAQSAMRKEILETGGFLVVCAATATEAIEIVRETPISLVLSDHMLSGATGIELAAEIKRIKPDVPVVLYSGRPPESMENIDCFINKGESVPTFLSMMRDVVNRYWGVIHSSQQPR